ncbi:Uncharacterized protein Adt_18601 [Abeliophyllum distichum]|uniref:Uncharacterized protein n=1 Tax=Abeliophyllum distichum TaxID=126358 RepID=A0ABD1TJU1_9LAMI
MLESKTRKIIVKLETRAGIGIGIGKLELGMKEDTAIRIISAISGITNMSFNATGYAWQMINYVLTASYSEKNIDHPMSQLELFSHVHRTNHGLRDFIDKKSKRVHDKYKASIEFKYVIDRDDQLEFDLDSWIDAINGPSKGRIYGFDPRQSVSHVLGTPTSSCVSRNHRVEL